MAQWLRIRLPIQETGLAPSQEDSLEDEMATHSSILALEVPLTEKSGGLQCLKSQKSWTRLSLITTVYVILYSTALFFFFPT